MSVWVKVLRQVGAKGYCTATMALVCVPLIALAGMRLTNANSVFSPDNSVCD